MKTWKKVMRANELPIGSKRCVKFDGLHIVLIHYDETTWYAVQSICPHTNQDVLGKGIIGDKKNKAKIVCPIHKKEFSLYSGRSIGEDPELQLQTFPIKEKEGHIFMQIDKQLHLKPNPKPK